MYTPKHFEQSDPVELRNFIAAYPKAILVHQNLTGMEANHIPLYLIKGAPGDCFLRGHIARANPLWKQAQEKAKVLVIFQGPQSYISPNLYPSKKEDGKIVPTWNYAAVHITGEISFVHESKWKLDMLKELTGQLEAQQEKPWSVADAPSSYIEKQLNAIVGLEITVKSVQGKWKLSQNQSSNNQKGVVESLSQSTQLGAAAMSEFMRRLQLTL